MEGSVLSTTSSINSRSSAIKTVLLSAWRAKLSSEEWELRTRKILPRGVNGDVYDLADCLLRQALVGPVPNQLFISYLKHAVDCELVSHGAVLSSIAQQSINIKASSSSLANRTSSVVCLLDFLKSFRDKLSCKGNEVDCLNLCHSLSRLILWLLRCVQISIETLHKNSTANENISSSNPSFLRGNGGSGNIYNNNGNPATNTPHMSLSAGSNNISYNESILGIIDLCVEAILYFVDWPFTKSLLYISATEFSNEFDEILKILRNTQMNLSKLSNHVLIQEKVQNFKSFLQMNINFKSRELHPSIAAAQELRCIQSHRIRSSSISQQQNSAITDSSAIQALFNSLFPLVAYEVILRPARSSRPLARQIATLTCFNAVPISMTYCELIRVSLIGMIDNDGNPYKVNWAYFTFFKLPKLMIEISKVCKNPLVISTEDHTNPSDYYASNQNTNFINDLKVAIERICEYSPLLDEAEHKYNCDFFKYLFRELIKNDSGLVALKTIDLKKFPNKRASSIPSDSGVAINMMFKTETTVSQIVKATADTETNPAELYPHLMQLLSGKSFECALNLAASTGRLEYFVKRLLERNAYDVISNSEKNPYAQAFMFDTLFLILTNIAQHHGTELFSFDPRRTFDRWYSECYNRETRVNCPQEMQKNCNPNVVAGLIRQLLDESSDGLQVAGVNWNDVCFSLPKVIAELINAWNQDKLTESDMMRVSERLKSRMCFVAVIAANWLRSHIRTVSDQERVKPLSFLHSLTKASQSARQQKQAGQNMYGLKCDGYHERSTLMCQTTRKIYFEFVPKSLFNKTKDQYQMKSNGGFTSNSNNVSDLQTQNREPSNDSSNNEVAYHSINDRFMSSLTTRDIFLVNVKQALSRGWCDSKSLCSLNGLFKMIGSENFTNLIVEQILTTHDSPSDLGAAVNITFGIFHLDIEACAFALLEETVPSWLINEKKQMLLNQPRAFALAHLTVMTIIEVFNNLKAGLLNQPTLTQNRIEETRRTIVINGIKEEPMQENGPREAKKMKLEHGPSNSEQSKVPQAIAAEINKKLKRLENCVADLMRLFKEIVSDKIMSQRTLFPVLFLQQTVICAREDSNIITAHLQPEILLDIINLFSSELTFDLVLAISNLSTSNSRKYAAKATCQLAQLQLPEVL